ALLLLCDALVELPAGILGERTAGQPLGGARMRAEQDVARQSADAGNALPELIDTARVRGIAREPEPRRGHGREAVGIDDVAACGALARPPAPRRSAGRVAGRRVRRHREIANAQHL